MTMDRIEFVDMAEHTALTRKQAEALYRRQTGESRQEAADAMDSSPSNVDNLERAARAKIRNASNLLAIAETIGAGEPALIGTCAVCDEPAEGLSPHPDDDGPLKEQRMICDDCNNAES